MPRTRTKMNPFLPFEVNLFSTSWEPCLVPPKRKVATFYSNITRYVWHLPALSVGRQVLYRQVGYPSLCIAGFLKPLFSTVMANRYILQLNTFLLNCEPLQEARWKIMSASVFAGKLNLFPVGLFITSPISFKLWQNQMITKNKTIQETAKLS